MKAAWASHLRECDTELMSKNTLDDLIRGDDHQNGTDADEYSQSASAEHETEPLAYLLIEVICKRCV